MKSRYPIIRATLVRTEELLQATASYEKFWSGLRDLRATVEADEVKPSDENGAEVPHFC